MKPRLKASGHPPQDCSRRMMKQNSKAALMKLGKTAEAMETFPEGMEGSARWPEIEERKISLRIVPNKSR